MIPVSFASRQEKLAFLKQAFKDPVFKRARIIRANRLYLQRRSVSEIREMLDSMLEDHWKWIEVRRQANQKIKRRLIAQQIGLRLPTVHEWISGVRPLSLKPGIKDILHRIPFTPEMAFLVAVYNARHLHLQKKGTMLRLDTSRGKIRTHGQQLYDEVCSALRKLGVEFSEHKVGKDRKYMSVKNPKRIIDELERFSSRQQAIPIHLLDSEEKIKQYLRGVVVT